MTTDELKSLLRATHAAIVHFSNFAAMDHKVIFPQDLLDALAHKDSWNLSCSVLWPRHNMKLCGDIGIIFCPNDISNVLNVSSEDAGSYQHGDAELSGGSPLTAESFEKTFVVAPGSYNEWRMRSADVKGMFVVDPGNIEVKHYVALTDPDTGESIRTVDHKFFSLAEAKGFFAGFRFFTMTDVGLKEV